MARMSITSTKNTPLTPAATDLGYGEAFQQQVQDELDERKKKLALQQNGASNSVAAQLLGLTGSTGGTGILTR